MANEVSKASGASETQRSRKVVYYEADYGSVRLSPAMVELMERAPKVWELETAIEMIMKKAYESGVEIEEL